MPTGLTANIYEGKDTSLRDFALRCVRQLGAGYKASNYGEDELPKDKAPILKVADFYYKNLRDAENERKFWLSVKDNPNKVHSIYESEVRTYEEEQKNWQKTQGVNQELLNRYEDMMKRIQTWEVGENYQSLKSLMIRQLQESIAYDCNPHNRPYEPFLDFDTWFKLQIECSEDKYKMCKERLEKEEKSVRETNEYLEGLYETINKVEPLK